MSSRVAAPASLNDVLSWAAMMKGIPLFCCEYGCANRIIMLSTDSVSRWLKESVVREEQRRLAAVATVSLFSVADTLAFVVLQESNRAVHERRRKKSNFFIGTIIFVG
jgi:hypothetical protein